MGRLFDIIQAHIDAQPYGASERSVAKKIGVSPTTLANWREPKKLVRREHLQAIARVTGVPYQAVLYALLEDIGYMASTETNVSDLPLTVGAEDLEGLPNVAQKRRQRKPRDDSKG